MHGLTPPLGYGWKLAYFPYLVVGDVASGSQVIYGAEKDGSVIAYRRSASNTNVFEPTPEDNPSLKNLHNGGVGSVENPMNNRLVKSQQGGDTIYTLSGPNGQVRTFKVQSFPVVSGGTTLTRERPYLQSWIDAHGNTLNFTYETSSASSQYGFLKRIAASNGNFIGFDYDVYGHIVEAWTGDGRRIRYTYDSQGDLRTVTLPDAAVHSYEYAQETTTSGGESVQTSKHLLIQEIKPGGRILVNEYDDQRRVVVQKAVVGTTAQPVTNATFTYSNTQDSVTKTWTGQTTVQDAYGRATVFTYADNLITSEDDPETPPEVREWYGASETGSGAYPRSLKSIVDRRGVKTAFKYDSKGNLIEKSIGTDSHPADINGDGQATSGEKAVTTWTYTSLNLPASETGPTGNETKWYYEDTTYPYLATRIESLADNQLVSQTTRTFTSSTGSTLNAKGLLEYERVAAGSPDEAVSKLEYPADGRGYPNRSIRYTGTTDPDIVMDLKYNLRGELTEVKDSLGRVTNYAYDAMGRRIWSERRATVGGPLLSWDYVYFNPNGEPEWTDGAKYNPEDYTYLRYDGNGRLIEELQWRAQAKDDGSGLVMPLGDQGIATTIHKYDMFGNRTETYTPRGNSISMVYDQIGRMTSRSYHEGIGGAVKATETFTYEPGNEIATQTSVLGGVTSYLYNALGQVRQKTNPDGTIEEWRYYLDGRPHKEILRNGSYWETIYDDANRTVSRILKNAGGTTLKTSVTVVDRRGNEISKTVEGHTTTTAYDDLNRVKSVTGPAATTGSAQQVTSYSYPDGAGREEQVSNALSQTTTTLRDALGRVQSVDVAGVQSSSFTYSADHRMTTATVGSGPGALVTRTWVDNNDKTAITKKADDTFETYQYDNGGLLLTHRDRAGRITSYTRDWRGDVLSEVRPGDLSLAFVYDVAGNLLERQMPGGVKEINQFDSIGRQTSSKLMQGANTTRLVTYAYNTLGLLESTTDARGIVTTRTYDDSLRLTTLSSTGPDAEDAVSTTMTYDGRDLVVAVAETGIHGTTLVSRSYDDYGRVGDESVSIGGVAHSSISQTWDAAGRRSGFQADPDYQPTFGYRADGLLTSVTVGGNTYASTYGNNGLLTGQSNPFRTVTVQTRDSLGRITDRRTTVGGVLALKETIPSWWAADKMMGLHSERVGQGAWNEARDYAYDVSGRLIKEEYTPRPGAAEDAQEFFYDNLAYEATGGIGVRTKVLRTSDSLALNEVPSVGTFARVTNETFRGLAREVSLSGVALGADKVSLTLDGREISPVTFGGWADSTGDWSATVNLVPGEHELIATATHPSGWVAPSATSNFEVASHPETVTSTYDEMGNVATRTWSGGKVQTLTWDARGRLVKVVQTGVAPSEWQALYDGLGRRLRTTYTPEGGNAVTVSSTFDPQVEFLEIGTTVNGVANWKVYGPDISGSYGGLQGTGGLEAILTAEASPVGIVNDLYGNVAGVVPTAGAPIRWSATQYLAWGTSPVLATAPQGGTRPLYAVLGYRGLPMDPTGMISMGKRPYDPEAGRWLAPDPMGNTASLSLYDYSDNDPINIFDPDGRFGKGYSSGKSASVSSGSPNSWAFNLGMSVGGGFSGGAEGLRGGASITVNTFTFGGSDHMGWTNSSQYQGAEYTFSRVSSTVAREFLITAGTLGTAQVARGGSATAYYAWQGLEAVNAGRSGYQVGTGVVQISQGDYVGGGLNILGGGLGAAGSIYSAAKYFPAAKGGGGNLIHLTDAAGEAGIMTSNSLNGSRGIFAVPSYVANESTALKVARTGLMPAQTSNFVNVPQAATSLFQRPVPIGPYSAWKYFGGVRYAAPGSINMSTGAFTPGSSLIGPKTLIYGPDAILYGGGGALGGYYLYNQSSQ